ncbi:hypothetical protein [Actinacidiphila sp. bgisy167]|uniref:hypothetical protein n=1 Tax=Actinacidiphila sp. bgisy167 TaxID=3413797 RepID=UPI003D747868
MPTDGTNQPMAAEEFGYAVDDSALRNDCAVWFALPPGFVEIPYDALLAEPDTERAVRLIEAIGALLELIPEERHEAFVEELREARVISELLRAEGTVHCSMGVHEAADGSLVHSVFTIMWRQTPWMPPVLGAAKAATARDADVVEYVDLPCGPAALTEGTLGAESREVYQAAAHLAHPDGRHIAVLTLSTTATAERGHYRDILGAAARMVSFDNPLPASMRARIPESEVAASVRSVFG